MRKKNYRKPMWFYVFDKQLKAENLSNQVVLKNTSEKHLMKLT